MAFWSLSIIHQCSDGYFLSILFVIFMSHQGLEIYLSSINQDHLNTILMALKFLSIKSLELNYPTYSLDWAPFHKTL